MRGFKNLDVLNVLVAVLAAPNTAAGIVYGDDGLPFAIIHYGEDHSACINEVLLEKGYARVDPDRLPGDCRHYLEIQEKAKAKERGIWAGKGD